MTKASFCGSCLLLGKPEFGRGLSRTWGGGSVWLQESCGWTKQTGVEAEATGSAGWSTN